MEEYITIPFQIVVDPYYYADALHLTQAEIDSLGPQGITAVQEQRYQNWIAELNAPPDPNPPPPEPIPDAPTEEPI